MPLSVLSNGPLTAPSARSGANGPSVYIARLRQKRGWVSRALLAELNSITFVRAASAQGIGSRECSQ